MRTLILLVAILLLAPSALAAPSLTTGDFHADTPTLHSMGFRWHVMGDDDWDSIGTIEYREQGSSTWKSALPMMRTNGEVMGFENEWSCPNQFAGSILGLETGTTYEYRITLADPDGVSGTTQQSGSFTTRAVPTEQTSGTTHHVYTSCAGSVEQPCYTSVRSAYQAAQPGELILIHDGIHTPTSIDLSGIYKATTAQQPIIIRGETQGGVILDGGVPEGGGNNAYFNLRGTRHIHLERFTIQNAGQAIHAAGAIGLVVRDLKIHDVYGGITGTDSAPVSDADWYIADNDIRGWNDAWAPYDNRQGINRGGHGIVVAGTGHIIEHNRVGRFYDCLGHIDGNQLRADRAATDWRDPWSHTSDFSNNDIYDCVDDGIVLDFSYHNMRVWHNRLTNMHSGISLQPFYCGPAYIYRNTIYNIPEGNSFKTHNEPAGFELYHNAVADANYAWEVAGGWQNARIKNNIFLDRENIYGAWVTGDVPHPLTEIDHNALQQDQRRYGWRGHSYTTHEQMHSATGYQEHGFDMTYADLASCSAPPGESATPNPADCNFAHAAESRGIDAGVLLAGINDDYAGSAPDVGPFEYGSSQPLYGPRGEGGGLPPCGSGPVLALCTCGPENISSGYCCDAYPQSSVACTNDAECDDADTSTRDTCENPDSCEASCTHTPYGFEAYNETYIAYENIPLDFFGTPQGTSKHTTIDIETLANAQSATLLLGSVDIDSQSEVGFYINSNGDLDVPPQNIRNQAQGDPPVYGERDIPLAYLVEGENDIEFRFDSASGTSGFTITDVEITIAYEAMNTTPTCTDGVQNGDETGVDCGGSCPPCDPTCDGGLGDLDCSGLVDIFDLTLVGSTFGCSRDHNNCWDAKAQSADRDTADELVDIEDLNVVSQHFDQEY